jgi:hypothetical protein
MGGDGKFWGETAPAQIQRIVNMTMAMTNEYHTPSQNSTVRDNDDDTDDGNNHRHNDDDDDDDNNPPKNDSRNKNTTTTNDNETTNLLFSCQCDSARQIATLLSCLRRVVTSSSTLGGGGGGTNDYYALSTQRNTATTQPINSSTTTSSSNNNRLQHATVYAGPSGLTFHVQHGLAKQAQCSVDMPTSLFRHYIVGEEEVWLEEDEDEDDDENNVKDGATNPKYTKEIVQGGEFGINLTTVLECFAVLSKKTTTGNHNSNYTNTNTNYKVGRPPTSGSVDHGSGASGGGVGGASSGSGGGGGEYASLANVPLCMSYDRGSATFHLEFLDKGGVGGGGGGCLVTCEVPGVAVADDDTGHDVDATNNNDDNEEEKGNNEYCNSSSSGLAMAFRASPLISRAILHSDSLLSAVSELYDVLGASIVEISLTPKGLGFGCIGPRSEVWVNVPYHRGQGGLYVGLECYALPNSISPDDTGRSSNWRDGGNKSNTVRRYPLGAFLSGMRGLDIGIETCISVNSRGMMAIQHQVSRDGHYHDSSEGGTPARPSFVDFIMTCIEDVDEDQEGVDNHPRPTTQELRSRHDNGLQDITNSTDSEDLGVASRKARDARYRDNGPRTATTTTATNIDERVVMSSDEEVKDTADDFPIKKTRRKDTRQHVEDDRNNDRDFGGMNEDAFNGDDCSLGGKGEIIGNDMSSSNKSKPLTDLGGRKKALDDIRRRRQERHQQEQQTPPVQRENPTQTQSDDDDGDTTEPEDSLDVTAEIPNLFSKRSSLLTSARAGGGKRRKNMTNDSYNSDNDESDGEQEPRMMYGDTKLEFTQDGYSD